MTTNALDSAALMPLLDDLDRAIRVEFQSTARVVAQVAEVDRHDAYRLLGFDTMLDYCVQWCRLSEDAALRRIQVARKAREFPILFEELREGRLNLSGACLLAPHLTKENVGEFVEAARHRTNAQIKELLTEKLFVRTAGRPTAPERQIPVPLPPPSPSMVLAANQAATTEPVAESTALSEAVTPPAPDPGPLEYEMRFTMTREDHERFRYAQALLSHAVPSGDVAAIFRRAIEAVITECEKRKFGARTTPVEEESAKGEKPAAANGRHIPAHVRRAVWVRDGGRCTYVTPAGHRCGARTLLEFDHVTPVARGGRSTVENLRLRCRAHNQDEAERALGSTFMQAKRRKAAIARSVGRTLPEPWNGVESPGHRRRVMKA